MTDAISAGAGSDLGDAGARSSATIRPSAGSTAGASC